ncbi:hypothetical protein [Psychromonas aquimarina]|uniref:hypothetical protein n=1 Tax=Psychromonas aquimarina TaxID=444919 RepID=UPI0006868EE0|nr:hypothetical protein [Psychromonas aquimarina]
MCCLPDDYYNGAQATQLTANTPYLLDRDSAGLGHSVLNQLNGQARKLTELSFSLGADNVMALSAVSAKLKNESSNIIGTTASLYTDKMGNFSKAIKAYQDALMEYRDVSRSQGYHRSMSTSSSAVRQAKQKAIAAFNRMQERFAVELEAVNSGSKAKRGTVLSSAERGTSIARSSRSVAKLDISNQAKAHDLVKFSRYAKGLGNGLALIDFGSRIGKVHNSYLAGENWHRKLFIESSSFAASALTASTIMSYGLAFFTVATPLGWVCLIAVAAGGAMLMNDYLQENSGRKYDSLMDNLR